MSFLDDLIRGAQSARKPQAAPTNDQMKQALQARALASAPKVLNKQGQQQWLAKNAPETLRYEAPHTELPALAQFFQELPKAAGTVAKAPVDFVAGTITGLGNRVADFGQAGAHDIMELSGQNQRLADQQKATNTEQTLKVIQNAYSKATDPARRQQLAQSYRNVARMEGDGADQYSQLVNEQLDATDPRKTLTNAAETALDIVTAGKGKLLLDGVKTTAAPVTKEAVKNLLKNAAVVGAQGAGIGAAYGGVNTARDQNATLADYAKNMGTGAVAGAISGVGAQAALPVIGRGVIKGAEAAQNTVNNVAARHEQTMLQNAAQHSPVIINRLEHINPAQKPIDQALVSQHIKDIQNKTATPVIGMRDDTGYLNVLGDHNKIEAYKQLGFDTIPTREITPGQLKMMKQGGYHEIPGSQKFDHAYVNEQVASHNNPDEYTNKLVDNIWSANKKGKGVDSTLIPDEYGGGMQGRVSVSNNSRFYQDFYAEYGKPPTKAAIKDMVEQTITGKPGQYKNLLTEQEITPLDAHVVEQLKERQASLSHKLEQANTSRPEEAPTIAVKKQLPTTDTLSAPINLKDYLKQQSKAQEAARKQGANSPLSKFKTEFSTKVIDSLSPLETPVKKAIKSGVDVPMSKRITPQLDRALRADTIAGQYIKDKGLAKVIQSVPDTKTFDQYLIAKHAADLEKNGIKTGRNLEADKQLVESLKSVYEPHAQAVTRYNQELLDKAVEYGLTSKETAAMLKEKYPNYVPANRIFGENEVNTFKGNGKSKASLSTQSVVQKIKGSTREIESPLSSIANKTNDVISQGERNKAASILASYKDLPGNPYHLREMAPSETVGTKSTIAYLDNGKVRRFETTPEIETAAKSLNKEQIGILGKIVRIPTRALRLGATGVNVGFTMANLAKDLVSAAINSEHAVRASVLNPKVLGKATAAALNHKSKSYGEMVREGAGGTSFDIARDAPKKTVAQIRAEKNMGTRALYTVTHPSQYLRAVEDTIGRSEEFTRAMQYFGNKEAAVKKGLPLADAKVYGAHAARNNSVNFARAGDYGAVLNSALPYLNAGIQGARTFVRTAKERPVQTAAKVAILSTLPALTTTAWNIGTPERKAAYDDISEYEKQGNFIIVPEHPVKDEKTGRWNVIKIPVSQEIANLNNIARNTVESMSGDANFNVAALLGDLIGTTTSISAENPRQAIGQFIPQALKPAVETLTNQNLYSGNQIVPDSQKNLPANEQYGDYTSGTAKTIGSIFGQSPRMIDNTIKTAFGGAGQTAVNTSDSLLAKLGMIDPASVQGKSLEDSVSSRFFGASAKPTTEYVNTAFDKAKKDLMATSEYKSLSQVDKAKALNRLETDVKAIEYNKADTANPNPNYPAKDLTKNQQSLSSGTKSITDYTKSAKDTKTASKVSSSISSTLKSSDKDLLTKYDTLSAQDKKKFLTSSNDAEFKYEQAKYNNDKASGKLSDTQDIKAQAKLAKLQAGKDYSKQTRELYSLNKTQIYNYVSNNPNGAKLAKELQAYDQALYDAGLNPYLKFKTGIAPAVKTARKSSSGTRRTGGTTRRTSARTSQGVTTAKADLAAISKANKSSLTSLSSLSKKVASAKVAKKQLPSGNKIKGRTIMAYKKPGKTNVSMTRKA